MKQLNDGICADFSRAPKQAPCALDDISDEWLSQALRRLNLQDEAASLSRPDRLSLLKHHFAQPWAQPLHVSRGADSQPWVPTAWDDEQFTRYQDELSQALPRGSLPPQLPLWERYRQPDSPKVYTCEDFKDIPIRLNPLDERDKGNLTFFWWM